MDKKFVSVGGVKLQEALDSFKINVSSKVCLDVGSSTGGFVDCLLQNGASRIYSVDTAYGQLAWQLRNDPRVAVLEKTNILHLAGLPEKVDLITIDAGWTRLGLVLPVVSKFLKEGGVIIALLKPHYEAEREELERGVVKPDSLEDVKERVVKKINGLGFSTRVIDSPILGSRGKGNKEFLVFCKL